MAASQYNLYYDTANSSWNEYLHVSLLSSNYLYLGSIANGGSFGNENHLLKIAKSDLSLTASNKWDTALVNMNVQGLCTDNTYLYWTMCYNNVIQYSAIVKTDLSLAHVKSIYWNNTGICPQQIQLMKAYDGTSYLVSIQNSMSNVSSLRTIIADHTNWAGSVTATTNRLFTDTYLGSIRQIDPTSSGSALIGAGVQVVGGVNRAVLVKINQIDGSPYGRLDTTIAYQSSLERQGFSETDTFAVSFLDTYVDPDDTAYIWAVGNCPKSISTPLVGRNTILARFKLSDMTLQNLVEISSTKTTGTNYGFAGASILLESDKIYISTWHLPHTGLGDNTEVTTDCTYVVTCLDKSNILAASGTYVNFSLAYEEGGAQGQAGNLGSGLWSDGTYIYACPWTSVGSRAGWSAAVIKIDRTRGTGEAQYLDATAAIKEYDFSSYLSFNIYDATAISQIVAASHGTWHNHILTNQAWDSTADEAISNRTDGIAAWTPTVKGLTSIDSTSLIEYLRPNGAGDSIRSVYGQAATWVPSGTSTANLYTVVDEVTLDSTDRIISRNDATWTGEIFTLSDPSTSVQRILKAEIGAVARYGGATSQPYIKYLWRTTGTTALHNAGSWVESSAIYVGTAFAEVANIDITTVSTALKPNWTRDDIVNLQVGGAFRGASGLYAVGFAQQWVKLTWEPFNYQAPTLFADVKFSDANSYSWSQTYDVAPESISATASVTVPTLAQIYVSAPAIITATVAIIVPTIAQVYVSAPANVSATAAITVPTLTQVIAVTPADISITAAVSVPILSQLQILTPADVTATGTVGVSTLVQAYTLTVSTPGTLLAKVNFENELVDEEDLVTFDYGEYVSYVAGRTGYAARSSHAGDDGSGSNDFCIAFPTDDWSPTNELYVKYYVKYEAEYINTSGNVKLFRTDGADAHNEIIYSADGEEGILPVFWQCSGGGAGWDGGTKVTKYGNVAYTKGDWLLVEIYFKLSSGETHMNADGIQWLKLNGTTVISDDDVITGAPGSFRAPSINATANQATGHGWWQIDDYEIYDSLTAACKASVTAPTLAQLHNILPANYQARAEISEVVASTLYTISGTNISARAAVNQPVITQIYSLAPANISSTSAVSAAALLSEGNIAAVSISATASVSVPTLTQVHAIVPADIGITAVLSSVATESEGQMTPISIVAYESITEPVLTQLHMATPANVTATETITPPVLSQIYTIAGANVSALALLSDAILTESASAVISPANMMLYPTISVPILSQAHVVSVSNVSATKAITAVNVSETGANVLSIAAVTGTATLSAATLSQIYSIQAANVAAGGQESVVVLTQDHIIAAADISASATVDTLNIVYGQFLTIDNVVANAGVTSATLVIDAWEQTLVIDGITKQAALSIASVLQTHAITPTDIMCNAVIGSAGIGTFGKIYKPQIKSLSYKRLTIESK